MFPKLNNPFWPLPPDYEDLSAEGRRQARVAVCRDETVVRRPGRDGQPERFALGFIAGHLFFRNYYLAPEGPKFYGESGLLPPAPGHIDMLNDFALYPFCAEAYTRGGGKSTIFARETPLRGIVCFPYREVVVSSASEKLAAIKAESVMTQLEENERITADFGKLVPARGSGRVYNKQHMRLNNGSLLEQLTVGSRQRGTRTSWYILDDPEYDPESNVQERLTELSRRLQEHITRVILPMLNPQYMKLFWPGTMLGARSYLYHVCFSKDPRYKNWMRRVQSGAIKDPETGKVIASTWPERFSVAHLELLRTTMAEHFDAEFMNQPQAEGARLLTIDPVANEYRLSKLPDNLDDRLAAHLPHPEAAVDYHYFTGYGRDGRKTWQVARAPAKEYFDALLRVATIDYAKTRTSVSDMKCIVISGFDARNVQWVLDCWAGRMPDTPFLDHVLRFCCAWRVQIIAPEAVSLQQLLVDAITRRIYEGEAEGLIPLDWRPAIIPLTYPKGADELDKGGRIKLWGEYPLPRGMVKFPISYKHKWPFNEMWRQVQYFTKDLRELRYDDIIDTLAMTKWVPHGRGTAGPSQPRDPAADLCSLIRQGKPFLPGGEGLVGLPLAEIREEHLALLVKQAYDNEEHEKEDFVNVWDQPQVIG
ncbi:MAG: hypothetical protein V2A79_09825 [Planctomycetota bacterium]